MRIVYVLTSLGVGGAERLALTLAAQMAARGHSVHVMVLRRLREEWPTPLPVTQLDLRKTPMSATAGLLRAGIMLRTMRPDLIHSHGFHANLFARALRVLVASPALISTVHNVYEGGVRRMLAYRITDRLSTRTTVVSEAVARRFIREHAISAMRCLVIPNAIEMAGYAPDAARRAAVRAVMGAGEEFVWLAAGRIAPAKDYPNLLCAFARVRAATQGARLWIAGESRAGGGAGLGKLAEELGIADSVCWLGLRRDLPALLDAADGFVSSSAWEGMPLTLAEAMAMRKPVVVTDAGGVREVVGQAGRLVPVRDSASLAEAMIGMMGEPAAVRRAMGLAARQRIAEHFNWETRAGEWEEIYRAVTSRC